MREKNCASSAPTGPPPITTKLCGTLCVRVASRFVQYSIESSPSSGGGAAPPAGRLCGCLCRPRPPVFPPARDGGAPVEGGAARPRAGGQDEPVVRELLS